MAIFDRLYVVQWSDDGHGWWVVWDDTDGRKVPAAYYTADEAEKRRARMADQHPDAVYRVVGFEHRERD